MRRILITGASGFIGHRFLIYNKSRFHLQAVSLQQLSVSEIDFNAIDTIVHLAGMAHQMQKIEDQLYFDVNYELTKRLALRAKEKGVPHFIFISTIKVFGEHQEQVLNENSPCVPINDPYGQSKLEAEKFLQEIEDDNFVVSIVRPPLVYGPGVKGNLLRLLKLVDTPFPLPFAGINNRRSMVSLDNLIALINTIIEQRKSGIFLAGDERPISTTYLITEMRKSMDKNPNLFILPSFIRKMLYKSRPELALRLFGSLEMDTKPSFDKLQFTPPYSTAQGICEMVEWYLASQTNTSV
jgi:nucleoside-diphosphate-sugar epimerase